MDIKPKRKKNKNRKIGDQAGRYPPTGNKGGTPSLYRPEYCERVILWGSNGESETEWAVKIGVVRSTMRDWGKEFPEFGVALARARECSMAWWERKGKSSLDKAHFGWSGYNKIISCRFRGDYSEKVVISGDEDAPIVHEIRRIVVK